MAIPMGVETRFTAKDQVSATYKRMGEASDAFERKAKNSASALRNATKQGYQFGTVVKGILAANVIRGGIGAISGGIATATRSFIDFEEATIGAVSRFDDLGPGIANFNEKVIDVQKGITKAVAGTRVSQSEGAKIINEYAKAGFDVESSLGALRSSILLASAANTEFNETASMSARLLGSFGLRSRDPQVQMKNMIALNEMMGAAANMANGDFITLFETLKTAAPVGSVIGATKEELISLAVAVDQAGIDASMAGTSIKNAILGLARPDVIAELKANNIAVEDELGKFRSVIDIFTDISNVMDQKRLDFKPEKAEIIERLFGRHGMAGIIGLLRDTGNIKQIQKNLMEVADTNKQIDDRLKQSLGYKLDLIGNAMLTKSFEVFNALNTRGKKGLDGLLDTIKNFDTKPLIQALTVTLELIRGVIWIIGKTGPYMKEIITTFGFFYGLFKMIQFVSWVRGLQMMSGGVSMLSLSCTGLTAALLPLTLGLLAVTSAWAALNSAVTGKDNIFSELAQGLGIVPKLQKDAQGRVVGYAAEQNAWNRMWLGDNNRVPDWATKPQVTPAPNAREAEARQSGYWQGQLNIVGAPAGSNLVEQKSTGLPVFNTQMLGAN